jgi:outer membrane protein assembly factor BamE (lipoprotein component of BamABCDE complex)
MTEAVLATPRKRRSRAIWIAGVLAAAAVLSWAILFSPLPFVASWWNVDFKRGTTLETRYRVADGLASSGRLRGMVRSEVLALLGTPPETDKFQNHGLVYVLGPERGLMSIDYEWLLVDFDWAGKGSSVAVVTD